MRGSSETEAVDGGEDIVGGFGPPEWLGIGVCHGDVVTDGRFQFGGGSVNTAAQSPRGEQSKPSLNLVDPGGRGRRVMDMPMRSFGKPAADHLGLVRAGIVHNDVGIEIIRH